MGRRGQVLTATAMGQITSQPLRYSLACHLASLSTACNPGYTGERSSFAEGKRGESRGKESEKRERLD